MTHAPAAPHTATVAVTSSPPRRDPMHLTEAELAELEAKFDAVRDEVFSHRGQADAQYIRRVVALQRSLEMTGRACMLFSRHRFLWWAGVG